MLGLGHALTLVKEYLEEVEWFPPRGIFVRIPGGPAVDHILRWLNNGILALDVYGASEVIDLLVFLDEALPCCMCIRAIRDTFFEDF